MTRCVPGAFQTVVLCTVDQKHPSIILGLVNVFFYIITIVITRAIGVFYECFVTNSFTGSAPIFIKLFSYVKAWIEISFM